MCQMVRQQGDLLRRVCRKNRLHPRQTGRRGTPGYGAQGEERGLCEGDEELQQLHGAVLAALQELVGVVKQRHGHT